MSKYVKDDAYCIADLDDFTLSTGIYDYLYNEWYEKFSASVTLKLSEHEQRKVAFYAGMKAAQQPLALDVAESPRKCTTEKLCPVHNVWHAAPPRK